MTPAVGEMEVLELGSIIAAKPQQHAVLHVDAMRQVPCQAPSHVVPSPLPACAAELLLHRAVVRRIFRLWCVYNIGPVVSVNVFITAG